MPDAWKISGGTNQQLSKTLLKAGWNRGCYFLCEENQEAVDVIIPTSHNANSYEVSNVLVCYNGGLC